jgi:dihydroorotase/N-acyl-D-amino-acid deacylase
MRVSFLTAIGLVAFVAPLAAQTPRYDLLIAGGTVIDGSGAPGFRADVAITGDRIALVSRTPIAASEARRVVDATGLVVAPGFIDLHAHLEPITSMPDAESHVRQGVTLALGGPDGGGASPMKPYLDRVAALPLGMNVAFLTGHNTIRRRVMGTANRAPTPAELAQMRRLVAEAMGEGAFGLSTGLRYVPGYYSKTDEVVALAQAAADSGGIYTSHLREEGLGLLEGVAEALEIGRRAKIPVVLTHHKAVGRAMWGKSAVTLAMVDSARRAGTDVMIDQYPYTASHTGISVLVPPWALAGGDSALARRLADPVLRDSIHRGIVELLLNDRGGGDLRRVQFSRVEWDSTLNGRTLHDLAVRMGVEPVPEKAPPVVLEAVLKGGAGAIYHVMDEQDVRRIMAHPQTMIASDGRLNRLGDASPHPRAYGTFPRVLGKYVREDKVLSLESAVQKMTGMPAARLGLTDRGCMRDGCAADVTIFDANAVRDVGTFEDPHHYPHGIAYVIVNGVPVVHGGRFTEARPGRVLRRGG